MSDVFLIRLRLCVCVRKTTEVQCHCHHIWSRVHAINMACYWWSWPWSLGGGHVCQVSFSTVKLFFSPFHTVLLKWSHWEQSTFKKKKNYTSFPWGKGVSIYMYYLKFFCMGDLSIFSHVFIQSFIYIGMDLQVFILYFGL